MSIIQNWKIILQFLFLIYSLHSHTLILHKHPHVQIHTSGFYDYLISISFPGAKPFFPYLANFVVTQTLPFLLIETFILLYFSPGENNVEKTLNNSDGMVFKVANTRMREECEVRGVAFPWNNTCFPSRPLSIHKYPWQHLVSARRQTWQHTLWIPKGLGSSCWHSNQNSSIVRKRSQWVAGDIVPLGIKVLYRETTVTWTWSCLHSDISLVSHSKRP